MKCQKKGGILEPTNWGAPSLREASDLLCPGPTSLLSLNATPFAHLHHLPSPCGM